MYVCVCANTDLEGPQQHSHICEEDVVLPVVEMEIERENEPGLGLLVGWCLLQSFAFKCFCGGPCSLQIVLTWLEEKKEAV